MIRVLGFCSVLTLASVLSAMIAMAFGQGKSANQKNSASPVKGPSPAAQPYVLASAQSIAGIVKDLQSADKPRDLINAPDIGRRVYIQHEANVATNLAEVHDAADDIFIILEGSAVFILGGTLDAPKATQPGEWRAPGIAGGNEYKVSKGDVLIVPRGNPHRRITTGMDVTLMLIKASVP